MLIEYLVWLSKTGTAMAEVVVVSPTGLEITAYLHFGCGLGIEPSVELVVG